MEINEMVIKCPVCHVEGVAKSIMKEIEIPHFGKVLENSLWIEAVLVITNIALL